MNKTNCSVERLSNIGVGMVLGIIALGLAIVSITIFPIIAFIPAVAAVAGAVWFLAAPRSPACRLS